MNPPDPSIILDLIEAFRRSKTLFTATSLGVFDQLAVAPSSAAELAATLGCHTDAFTRLLDSCVALGLLVCEQNLYTNTPAAQHYLVSSSPGSLAGYVIYSDRSLYPLWGHLEEAIREGTNRWEQVFGSRSALFDHFFRDENATRAFLGGMHGFGQISSDCVVRRFDLSGFRRMVDLGGATGHLCIAACRAYPQLAATVFDLPHVERFAREQIDSTEVADRVQFHAGDFFADDLPPADLYSLGRILHDWDETKIRALLEKIFHALPSGGALFIAEALLNDDKKGPVYGLMQSLNMLVVTDGKERNCSEYRVLLEAAGFRSIQCRKTGTLIDTILARKP